MKKIVLAAVAALGLVAVSCNADAIEGATPIQQRSFQKSKTEPIASKKGDTTVNPTSNTTFSKGPGDDPIIILPPKKPKID